MKSVGLVIVQDTNKPILLTMADLARKLGVTKRTIARWVLDGQAKPGRVTGDVRAGTWIPKPDGKLGRTCFWLKSKDLDRHLAKIKARQNRRNEDKAIYGTATMTTAEIASYLGVSGKSIQRYVLKGQERLLWEPAFRDNPRLRWLPEPDHRTPTGNLWDVVPELRNQLAVLKALLNADLVKST